MASSLATTASASAAAASVAKTAPKKNFSLPLNHRHCDHSHSRVSFRLSPKPRLRFFSKGLQTSWNRCTVVRAQVDRVATDGSSNDAATPSSKSEVPAVEAKDENSSNKPAPAALTSEESISEFITQVASLVKLVDSRDIVELQLKQLDCEVLIRKKEALPQPPYSAPNVFLHSAPPPVAAQPALQALPPTTSPVPSSAPTPSPPAPKSAKPSLPSLKSPMAGTFYRSPAPAEPPFVKIGDKVQKGQVLCIIEAMKLMNEIEADQSGTVVEIIAEDGKPVSFDSPLFVIQP